GDVALGRAIDRMGEPIYRAQPPTGYPERAEPWVNAGALVTRINFGIALSFGRVKGTQVDPRALVEGVDARNADAVIDRLAAVLLGGRVSEATRATIRAALTEGDQGVADGEAPPVDARV